MTVSAQVSLYPLRQKRLGPGIQAMRTAIETAGLEARVGPMSTQVTGETESVFAALRSGFEQAASLGPVAMVVTLSNACPVQRHAHDDPGSL